ncbi:GroES-like protein [Aulographum hederae CBS 113979]|uniref:GroES-like protein n=1 Tax=Aulographum hederae CBS 113979 TaxID=1176131 RepID=A0A6G1H8I0_9PEZI|nr:GroES-like protein [Aulographum hederae CBS 113979]
MSSQHLAAVLPTPGCGKLEVVSRTTPSPGPHDVLIEVKAIAVNPIDLYQRGTADFYVSHSPAVIGSDIAGIVVSRGSAVGDNVPQEGKRVFAFCPTFYTEGLPDSGAFQKIAMVPSSNVGALPSKFSLTEGTLLPMAIGTTFGAWHTLELYRDTMFAPEDKQGMLVWGGASSIGSAAVQMAKLMGFTVYVTASDKHHEYIKTLGASKVFDYHSADVVEHIVQAAKDDSVAINHGYIAVRGVLEQCQAILKRARAPNTLAKLANCSPPRPGPYPTVEGVETRFMHPPEEPDNREKFFASIFNKWLPEKLESGEIVPSPKVTIVEGGLEGLNKALDMLTGASGEKFVVEV